LLAATGFRSFAASVNALCLPTPRVKLMFVRGKWYLAVVCDSPEPEKIGIEDIVGVDLGVVEIAFDSNGRP
jgi:transposase